MTYTSYIYLEGPGLNVCIYFHIYLACLKMLNKKHLQKYRSIYLGFLDRMILPLILKPNILKISSTIIVSNMVSLIARIKKSQTQSYDLNKHWCKKRTEKWMSGDITRGCRKHQWITTRPRIWPGLSLSCADMLYMEYQEKEFQTNWLSCLHCLRLLVPATKWNFFVTPWAINHLWVDKRVLQDLKDTFLIFTIAIGSQQTAT